MYVYVCVYIYICVCVYAFQTLVHTYSCITHAFETYLVLCYQTSTFGIVAFAPCFLEHDGMA